MSFGKITRNYQITIPAHIRKALKFDIGSLVDCVIEKGALIIKPVTTVDKDQSWFWTEEWQEGEREVEKARKKQGDSTSFDSIDAMKKHFEK